MYSRYTQRHKSTLSGTAVRDFPGSVVAPNVVSPKTRVSAHDTASKKLLLGTASDA